MEDETGNNQKAEFIGADIISTRNDDPCYDVKISLTNRTLSTDETNDKEDVIQDELTGVMTDSFDDKMEKKELKL